MWCDSAGMCFVAAFRASSLCFCFDAMFGTLSAQPCRGCCHFRMTCFQQWVLLKLKWMHDATIIIIITKRKPIQKHLFLECRSVSLEVPMCRSVLLRKEPTFFKLFGRNWSCRLLSGPATFFFRFVSSKFYYSLLLLAFELNSRVWPSLTKRQFRQLPLLIILDRHDTTSCGGGAGLVPIRSRYRFGCWLLPAYSSVYSLLNWFS